jgi:hypothetical protein
MPETVERRFHRDRSVRLNAGGKWICTIGRVWSVKKAKLVDKDWYFDGTEGDAIEKANTKARQWELLCGNWEKTERPILEILGEPMPHEPRWATGAKTPSLSLTPEQLADRLSNRAPKHTLGRGIEQRNFLFLINANDRIRSSADDPHQPFLGSADPGFARAIVRKIIVVGDGHHHNQRIDAPHI